MVGNEFDTHMNKYGRKGNRSCHYACTHDYIQRLEEDLKNDNTYEQVSKDMNTTIANKVKGLAKRLYNTGVNGGIKKYQDQALQKQVPRC